MQAQILILLLLAGVAAGIYVGFQSPQRKYVGWSVSAVCGAILIYLFVAGNQTPEEEKCPQRFGNDKNSPECPDGFKIVKGVDGSGCKCEKCQ